MLMKMWMQEQLQTKGHSRSRHNRRGGSTLIEFALVVPVLLLMLIGIMEFGLLVKNHLTVSNAAREGARVAAVGDSVERIKARVEAIAKGIPLTKIEMHITDVNGNRTGDLVNGEADSKGEMQNNAERGQFVRITVDAKHTPFTAFIPILKDRAIIVPVSFRRE